MKTIVPNKITTIDAAKLFLSNLHRNNESFHPEDDASEIGFQKNGQSVNSFTKEESKKLNNLMNHIYSLPGNNSPNDLVFDLCEFILTLDAEKNLVN